jgi:hypothetical protein
MRSKLDVVHELTIEEMRLAAIASDIDSRPRELIKARYLSGAIFYLVVDDNGGYQCDTIEELREFFGGLAP